MKTTPDTMSAYVEYAFYIEALRVLEQAEIAANPETFKNDPEACEHYGEFLAEVAAERGMGGSHSPRNDAERIWRSTQKTRALQSFAHVAPLHAQACKDLINGMYV